MHILKSKLAENEPEFKKKYEYFTDNTEFFENPGERNYQLLAYMSTFFENKNIVVWDAFTGLSSQALAFNHKNTVHSFTKYQIVYESIQTKNPNISFYQADLEDDATRNAWKSLLLSSEIIYVDYPPHDSFAECKLLDFLEKNMYEGIVIMQHIWENKNIRDNIWLKTKAANRCDLSLFGYQGGTGAIWFIPRPNYVSTHFSTQPLNKWTLVTAYFDLTKCPDASAEIRARDSNYYFDHTKGTLLQPYNMVIYCDQESLEKIKAIRPAHYNTQYEVREFDKLQIEENGATFAEFRQKIIQNRREKPYAFDPRNTASYYLFCLSRYLMMRETILKNPFESEQFCWINFCMERMGYKNLLHLEECLAQFRTKFSTCYIDYVPQKLVENTAEYFKMGRCSMCSGFFTGSKYYMNKVCEKILRKFLKYVEEGYGHADEQLYSPVYFENPDCFDQYFGDYTEMITNYAAIYERPEEPLRNFIRNSFLHGNYQLCKKACIELLHSIGTKKCKLSEDKMRSLERYIAQSFICTASDSLK